MNFVVPNGYDFVYTNGADYSGLTSGEDVRSGTHAMFFEDAYPKSVTLSQALSTTPGGVYQISWYAFSRAVVEQNRFAVTFGGASLFDRPLPNSSYERFTFTGVAAGPTTTLAFTVSDGAYATLLDDLSVTPLATTAPEPGTWALLGAGLVGVGAVVRRRRVR